MLLGVPWVGSAYTPPDWPPPHALQPPFPQLAQPTGAAHEPQWQLATGGS
jgi:hypothetical protein